MRDNLDRYYTPNDVAEKIVSDLAQVVLREPRLIVEPSVGQGAFVLAARRHWPNASIVGIDLDEEAEGLRLVDQAIVGDCLEVEREPETIDLVLGNPPFKSAETHLRHFLGAWKPHNTCMLLRLGFLASKQRHAFWTGHPLERLSVLSKRPSFAFGRTDNSDYGCFTWGPLADQASRIAWVG